jgi:hypothetical protein
VAHIQSIRVPVALVAATAGAPVPVTSWDRKCIYVDGTFVATMQVQISPDQDPATAVWYDEGAAISAKGMLEITKPCRLLRINTTAYTSGTPRANLSGVAHQDS